MKKSRFTEQQIAFALQPAEGGTGRFWGHASAAGALPCGLNSQSQTFVRSLRVREAGGTLNGPQHAVAPGPLNG